MKKVQCACFGCENRRRSHDDPYTPRGPQYIKVPDDYQGRAFCSIECSVYAKYYDAVETKEKEDHEAKNCVDNGSRIV